MAFFRKFHDWKIRHISYVILSFLILILLGSWSVLQFFGISDKDIIKLEIAHDLNHDLRSVAPNQLALTDKDDVLQTIDEINRAFVLLTKGGTAIYKREKIALKKSKGQYLADHLKMKEAWDSYQDVLLIQLNQSKADIDKLQPPYTEMLKSTSKILLINNNHLKSLHSRQTYFMLFVFGFSLLVFMMIYFIMRNLVLKPIYTISLTSRKLAKGNLTNKIALNTKNEIGYIAQNINALADILKHASDFTHEITKGNLKADYEGIDKLSREEQDNIAFSLLRMRDNMVKSAEGDKQRSWINEGMARFADVLRTNSDNQRQLSYEVITQLVKYLDISQGAFYILNDNEQGEQVLEMTGAYAYGRKKNLKVEIQIGEGLVGQCFLERQRIYLTEVPDHYITIRSGLGDTSPRSVLIVPMIVNEEIVGVLELASLTKFEDYKIDFVERLGETIASTFSSVKTNEQTRRLLEESNQMTEEMRSQEEEMRQNMEEMEATQEEMRRAQQELEFKEANLNALINNTDDSIITIDTNYKVMIINNVIKKRYQGTEFEGIDTGTNALDLLGSVRDEWKGYYDKALSGEKLEFIIKSAVKGENTYRQYNLNPIRDQNNEIVGASIFSRDITKLALAEREAQHIMHDLEQKNKLIKHTLMFAEIDPNKKITMVNDQLLVRLGYEPGELVNIHFNKLLKNEESLRNGLAKMHEGEIHEESIELKGKDGKTHPVKCCATAIFDNEKEIEKYALVFY